MNKLFIATAAAAVRPDGGRGRPGFAPNARIDRDRG